MMMDKDRFREEFAKWRVRALAALVEADARFRFWKTRPGIAHRAPSAGYWIATILGGVLLASAVAAFQIPGNAFRTPIEQWLSARLGREVHIAGDLHMRLLSPQPSIWADRVSVANADWAGGGQMAAVGHLHVETRLWPLLHGKLVLPVVEIVDPDVLVVRDRSGRNNWQFDAPSEGRGALPPIRRFLVSNGRLRIADEKRGLTFEGTITSREVAGQADDVFQLSGDGRLNRLPFHAEIRGGPLLNVDETKPYDFRGDVKVGATHVVADGAIAHPFDLRGMEADVMFSGSDLANLYYLTGLALPNTPPYRVAGRLRRDGDKYRFEKLSGRVGDSDLNGDLFVDASGARVFLSGDLNSRVLNFDDLGPLFGALPGKGRAAPPAQAAKAQVVAEKEEGPAATVLPDAPLQIERVRQMDANVSYRADRIKSRDFPLRSIGVNAKLDHGVLDVDPISVVFERGTIAGKARIDARSDVPVSDIDLRFTKLKLEQFFIGKDKPLEGTLEARAKVHGVGDSIHKAASTATGTVIAVVAHGTMRKSFAELMGINVTRGVIPLLFGDKSQTDIRCGVAEFQANDGVMKVKNFVFDTNVVRAEGHGQIDLRKEQLDLSLQGEPKSLELVRLRAPITIKGSLAKPEVGVETSKTLTQGGLAVAAGVFLSPFAAIVPFINPGLAEDADCVALVSDARHGGVTVKSRRG
jgi:uncharacterized protein involved in outer membrane biogenesis